MKIETRTVGDITILDVSGKITLGEGTMTVRNTVRDLLKTDGKKIILNGTTIWLQKQILLSLTKKIHELLLITKLLTVFQVFENEQAALASF